MGQGEEFPHDPPLYIADKTFYSNQKHHSLSCLVSLVSGTPRITQGQIVTRGAHALSDAQEPAAWSPLRRRASTSPRPGSRSARRKAPTLTSFDDNDAARSQIFASSTYMRHCSNCVHRASVLSGAEPSSLCVPDVPGL